MRFLEQARMSPQQTDLCITGIHIIYIYIYILGTNENLVVKVAY